ncbi:MAG: hypothetical protein WCF67_07115, partial [Chitinophagaceae bacterium]
YPFDQGANSIWYFNKEKGIYSFLLYPNGRIIQQNNRELDQFTHKNVINNCVNVGPVFWGQTFDTADTRSFITRFDMNNRTAEIKYDLYEIFRNSGGFSSDCFNASMDGSFIKINDSSFLFYNYYSSYFLWFNDKEYKICAGIDSLPLRTFKKISSVVEGYQVERCIADNENFVYLSGCSDGHYVYMLSNISSKQVKEQRLIDVFYANDMRYRASYIVPRRHNSRPYGIATDATSGSLYVTYDDNTLVKYIKPV